MTSTSPAARSWAFSLDHSSTKPQPLEAHDGRGSHNTTNTRSDNNNLHAHRQNHNSSKLPAFRFVDLRKDRISLPSLQQPTPLAPVLSQTVAVDPLDPTRRIPELSHYSLHHSSSTPTLPDKPASSESKQSDGAARTRSFKFPIHTTETTSNSSSTGSKRPASFPEPQRTTTGDTPAAQSQPTLTAIPVIKRRLTESAVKEAAAQGQRLLLLGKTIGATKSEDKKSRPPISYNPTATADAAATSSGRAVIPPIRSFRSSKSRKSVVLDMPGRRTSEDSYNEDALDPNQRDRALRTLEGRHNEDFSHPTPSDSGEMTMTTDNDNTADIFMKIAREDPAPRAPEKQAAPAEPSVVSRVSRAHRRPFSTSTPAYDVPSPPRLSRRLSDQRDGSRSHQAADNHPVQPLTRESSYRTPGRENLPPITTSADNSSRSQPGRSSMRPSPVTPRQISFKDSLGESSSAYQRRRQSLTENNNSSSSPRVTQYRNANLVMTQARTYHSSPLVPKSANVLPDGPQPNSSETNHGVEGTESSSSTAAPSTVWDELDELKSRIHRLERTGKMPSTSGGGMSRSSDERPRTATTNATTVSASPKRGSGPGSSYAEANSGSTPLAPRETQPLLLSALSKTKNLVKPDVFTAIESATTDAMALTSLIGSIGQPGPISSSASTIGGYNGSVTDRQLRKKADSICRSLTELCLALADPAERKKEPQPATAALEQGAFISPTANNSPSLDVVAPHRRPSAVAETVIKASTSPRAPTSLEQKRKTMLASISLPASRYTTAPTTPLESTAGRKSSLLLSRIRRTTTDEPEEAPQTGRRSSLLLRSRRNDSEEPEENREGRKTSLLLRTRKTMSDEEDESRARGPSRAVTEMNNFRMNPRESTMSVQNHQSPSEVPATPSALPRRRMIPSAIATRLAAAIPSSSTPTTPARKYLERTSFPERGTPQDRSAYQDRGSYLDRSTHQERAINNLSERLAEERGQQQRQASLGQSGILLNRSGSLGRRTRETGIPSLRS
ncbi:hypothetical protein F5144DRAFT_286723 [Chaetomium tenue]|uniref:Uncharacterized protein n=1 Tax=Chaetomium tenue TaxID=1854479 RepID=A0ACB7P3U0_9PEZI|nr:hypothetical protein F5144DRAFT_286723 [Chaetomium globosum]